MKHLQNSSCFVKLTLCTHYTMISLYTPSPALGNYHATLCFYNLTTSDTSYKWSHTVLVSFDCCVSLNMYSEVTHIMACDRTSFFKAEYSIVCTHHILFILLFFDGLWLPPLGSCEQSCQERGCANLFVSLLSVLLDIYPEMGLLNYMVVPYYFPYCLHHFTILPTVYKVSDFSASLPALENFCLWFFLKWVPS